MLCHHCTDTQSCLFAAINVPLEENHLNGLPQDNGCSARVLENAGPSVDEIRCDFYFVHGT